MAKKTPVIELNLTLPKLTKRRKFVCKECQLTYTLKHYRILYDAEKLSYFTLEEEPKYTVCHQCLYRFAAKFKEKLQSKKLVLKIHTEDEEIALRF